MHSLCSLSNDFLKHFLQPLFPATWKQGTPELEWDTSKGLGSRLLLRLPEKAFFSLFRVLFGCFFFPRLLTENNVCNNSGPNLIFKLLETWHKQSRFCQCWGIFIWETKLTLSFLLHFPEQHWKIWSKSKLSQSQRISKAWPCRGHLDFQFNLTAGISNPSGETQTEVPEQKGIYFRFFDELFIIWCSKELIWNRKYKIITQNKPLLSEN